MCHNIAHHIHNVYNIIHTHLHGVVHSRSEHFGIVVSKSQVNGTVHQLETVGVGQFSATPTFLHLGDQLDCRSDTERVVAIANHVTI